MNPAPNAPTPATAFSPPSPPKNPAEMYEQYFVPAMFKPWSNILLRHVNLQLGERVLDIACGTGIVARQAAPWVGATGHVTAVDMNPAMLAVARHVPLPAGLAIQWQQGNAIDLSFADGSFDVTFCQHGLQSIPDRAAALREMRRVLAPGGRALVMVLQALALHPVFEALMQSVANQLAFPLSAVMTPFVMSDVDALHALFEKTGFKTVHIHPETCTMHFPNPESFVPLAVASSAAAIPAFAQLAAPERAALVEAVRTEVEPILQKYRDAEKVSFPMFANVVVGTT